MWPPETTINKIESCQQKFHVFSQFFLLCSRKMLSKCSANFMANVRLWQFFICNFRQNYCIEHFLKDGVFMDLKLAQLLAQVVRVCHEIKMSYLQLLQSSGEFLDVTKIVFYRFRIAVNIGSKKGKVYWLWNWTNLLVWIFFLLAKSLFR